MNKILILVLILSSSLFSITLNECKDAVSGVKKTIIGSSTGVTNTGYTYAPSSVCGTSSSGVWNGQEYAGYYRTFSNWEGNFLGGVVDYETTYIAVCTQEDIPLSSPNGGSESGWINIGQVTCNTDGYSAEAEEFYANADSAFKTMTTSMTDCCGATDYYIKESEVCPAPTFFDFETATCGTCPSGEGHVGGECIPLSSQSCEVHHNSDWLPNSASSEDSCGALVDGVTFSNSSWHVIDSYFDLCCVLPTPPSYECSVLGDGWFDEGSGSESECTSEVDNVVIDGSNWISGTNVSDTCCLHTKVTDPTDSNETDPTNPADPTDSNETDPTNPADPTDSNETDPTNPADPTDGGGTNGSGTEKAIRDFHNDNNENLGIIDESINDFSRNNRSDLRDVNSSVNNASNRNHNDLDDIKDALSSDNDVDLEGLEGLGTILNDGVGGITQRFSSIVSYNLGLAPTFSESVDSCDYSITISYGTFDFPLSDTLDIVRPYLDGLWSFLFIYVSFIMYFKGFTLVVNLL